MVLFNTIMVAGDCSRLRFYITLLVAEIATVC